MKFPFPLDEIACSTLAVQVPEFKQSYQNAAKY